MSNGSNCPCGACNFPAVISNLPGLSTIQYRAGDFTSFRDALLHALPGEVELTNWKPTATSDLAVQMIEWWAYLADILTFYNQRIANQDYLRTADLDASVNRLIRVLGYRPRPGIGASATLAALVTASQPITLPQGFAVQSKPGPRQQPQIFELNPATVVQPGGAVSADPDNSTAPIGTDGTILLQGTVSSIKAGDLVLLVEKGWNGTDSNYVVATVSSLKPDPNPRGNNNTQVVLDASGRALPLPSGAVAGNYRLLRSSQTARLFQYGVGLEFSLATDGPIGTADLDSVTRQIQPGDMVLFDASGGNSKGPVAGPPISTISTSGSTAVPPGGRIGILGGWFFENLHVAETDDLALDEDRFTLGSTEVDIGSAPPALQLASVTKYTEVIWFANNPTNPANPPAAPAVGIPVLHSEITFKPVVSGSDPTAIVVRYGWQDAGVVIPPPATSYTGNTDLIAVKPPNFAAGSEPVLLEDANGVGSSANGVVSSSDTAEMQISGASGVVLDPPIDVLTNLLPFTRGKTVASEILGSGDATVAGQEFTLAKSPLTYLLSSGSSSGQNYSSTLTVWVNSVAWTEQPSFYGQPPGATIFVTREDENNITHVQFGDGVNGARLPTGVNNVVASYRFGSGQVAPAASTLTVITTAQPGLAAIHNPVAAGGGADPEPSSQIRKYAPLSVLAFGRAVSGDDYEAIAASTPGVNRASAVWSFDATQQRTVVTVYVGDDSAACTAALTALSGDADPNRPITVVLATQIAISISLTLVVDPKYIKENVAAAAWTALTDPDAGLFGANRIGIGEVIYRSQIYAACLSVPGALSVLNLTVTGAPPGVAYRFDPGQGSYFFLGPTNPTIVPEVASNG
jgi:hypothetical protein